MEQNLPAYTDGTPPAYGDGKQPTMTPPEDNRSGLFSNILAIAGFIIVVVIIIWGLVHLAGLSKGWFSSLFGGNTAGEEAIEITAPESAESGKLFNVEWNYEAPVAGTYAFLYQCANGFDFKTPNPAGEVNEIPCGSAYTVGTENNAIPLIPTLSGTTSIPMPFTVIFLPSATGTQAQGTASVMILGGSTNNGTSNNTGSNSNSSSNSNNSNTSNNNNNQGSSSQNQSSNSTQTQTPRPVTPTDLSVRILAVGVIDQYTGTFVNRYPNSPFETAAVQFEIANYGGKSSGSYYFTAQLPVDGSNYTYNSPLQASLTPGSRIVNTLRFTQVRPNGGTFTVSVDPSNMVHESNEYNNYATQFVSAPNYNQGNYPYPQYPYQQYYPYAY